MKRKYYWTRIFPVCIQASAFCTKSTLKFQWNLLCYCSRGKEKLIYGRYVLIHSTLVEVKRSLYMVDTY